MYMCSVFTISGRNLHNLGNNYYLVAPKTISPPSCTFIFWDLFFPFTFMSSFDNFPPSVSKYSLPHTHNLSVCVQFWSLTVSISCLYISLCITSSSLVCLFLSLSVKKIDRSSFRYFVLVSLSSF